MKKALIILVLISVLALTLLGCNVFGIIDKELKTEIIEDYLIWSGIMSDKTVDEIDHVYFGKYGESVAIYFHTSGAYETPVEEEIAGYTFSYPDSRVIRIWNNGKFYKMPEAYELGFITEDDVKLIKFKSQFLKFKEPYFIYEERIFPEPDFSDPTLVYCAVQIAIDKGISTEGKEISKDYFADIPIEGEIYPYYASSGRLRIILYLPELSAEELLEVIDKLYEIDGIMAAYPIYIPELDAIPNDPYYIDTEEYDAWALDKIDVENVWDFTTGSSEVRVGVIDTGIASHEDLDDNYSLSDAWYFTHRVTDYIENYKADTESHGTHIAGIIGAAGNNGVGISGVNWEVSLVQLRIVYGIPLIDTIVKALDWATPEENAPEIVPIINLSISRDDPDYDLEEAVRNYINSGGLLICSVGNKEQDNDSEGFHKYPGFYGSELYGANKIDNIITVGNIDSNFQLPDKANWGDETIDIYAPGENILSTIPPQMCSSYDGFCTIETGHISYGYHYYSGSSMSTPYVAGVAGLLLSVNPDLTAAQLKECILEGAKQDQPITTGDGTIEYVRILDAWGSFKYLMRNYPLFARTIGYNDVTYTYDIDADAEYMKDHTAMMKLSITDEGQYAFTVWADDAIDVKLYDDSITEITTTQTKTNNNGTVEFTLTLSEGTYYLRTNYVDSTSEGTVNVEVDCPHVHSYDYWKYESELEHRSQCGCGATGTETAPHAYLMGSINQTSLTCVDCGYVKYPGLGGFIPGPLAEYKVSVNGSYQMPDGTIYLVPEDLEAYLNGTLVFYDKDKVPVTQ